MQCSSVFSTFDVTCPPWPRICLVYVNDFINFAPNFAEHLSRLQLVFDRLRQAHLKLKPSKCYFVKTSVHCLGFISFSNTRRAALQLELVSKGPFTKKQYNLQNPGILKQTTNNIKT